MRLTHPDLSVPRPSPRRPWRNPAPRSWWAGRRATPAPPTPAAWQDRVYLSSDNVYSADDALLATLPHGASLNADGNLQPRSHGHAANGSAHVHFSWRYGCSRAGDGRQRRRDEQHRGVRGVAYRSLAPYADLLVHDVAAQPLLIGDPVDLTVSWTVKQPGDRSGRVRDLGRPVWLSTTSTFRADRLIGEFCARRSAAARPPPYTETQIITLARARRAGSTSSCTRRDRAGVRAGRRPRQHGRRRARVDVMTIPYADLVVNA